MSEKVIDWGTNVVTITKETEVLGEDECLLRHNGKHTGAVVQPEDLECSNCGYSRYYFFWYEGTGYYNRLANYCPGCGMRIFGVVTTNG